MADKHEKGSRKRSHSPTDTSKARKRVRLNGAEIKEMKRDKIISFWKEQDAYIDSLLAKLETSDVEEVTKLKESEGRLQSQVQELTRRENVLNMRLATKQEEIRNVLSQLQDLKESQTNESSNLHSLLIDPAINILFQQMSSELKASREKLEQAQNDLSAWKFTPDSVTGKKLMSKCRGLLQENQDLGKQISQGRVAQLEAEISLHKKHCNELKETYEEVAEYVIQQDEEGDALLATILHLQQQLHKASSATTTSTSSGIPATLSNNSTTAPPPPTSLSGGRKNLEENKTGEKEHNKREEKKDERRGEDKREADRKEERRDEERREGKRDHREDKKGERTSSNRHNGPSAPVLGGGVKLESSRSQE